MSVTQKKNIPSIEYREASASCAARNTHAEIMSLTQIQKLVHLLDRSDISEIELKRAEEGLHLVLRKLKAPERSAQVNEVLYAGADKDRVPTDTSTTSPDLHCLRAHMVGIFHPWLNPHGKILVAVGDLVKAGQIVGVIETLGILNEIKTSVAGRVVEVSSQDGQPVEYGQLLVTIDSSGEKKLRRQTQSERDDK